MFRYGRLLIVIINEKKKVVIQFWEIPKNGTH